MLTVQTNKEANSVITNESASYLIDEWSDVCIEEMYAYLDLLIFAGAHRSNDVNLRDLWSESRGAAIFRATMGRQRFELITKGFLATFLYIHYFAICDETDDPSVYCMHALARA